MVAWQHPCRVRGQSRNAWMGVPLPSSSQSSQLPSSCTELAHALKSQAEKPQWHPQETGWGHQGGLENVVAPTFAPFGPVLPGGPGGPYTVKIRSEESVYSPNAGRVVRGQDGKRLWGRGLLALHVDSGSCNSGDPPVPPAQPPPLTASSGLCFQRAHGCKVHTTL